jgi:hypothetical protein
VGLHVGCEVFLRLHVELHHRFSQLVGKVPNAVVPLQHGSVESAVNLGETVSAREVHQNQRTMSQEPVAQHTTSDVGGRVTGPNKLYSFQSDECFVRRSPEPVLFSQLS